MPSATPHLTPGTIFAGDFRVVRELRAGGMGTVYVVEQLSTGKPRALKLMLPGLVADAKLRQRFEQEARVGARIESEHIIEVVGAGVDEASETPWLAMELLTGEDLADHVHRVGPLSRDSVREIMEQLCHAIAAAHDAGIVHRDLKPENVFLAQAKRAGVQSTVKVLDFGIAKIVAEAKTTATAAIGSPMWMAPEQTARGGAIAPQTDVWALGLIAFYLLTGRYYWRAAEDEGATTGTLLREMVLDPLLPPSERAAEVGRGDRLPPGFDAWFSRTVNRDVQGRFQNAREMYLAFAELPKAATTAAPEVLHLPSSERSRPAIAATVEQSPLSGALNAGAQVNTAAVAPTSSGTSGARAHDGQPIVRTMGGATELSPPAHIPEAPPRVKKRGFPLGLSALGVGLVLGALLWSLGSRPSSAPSPSSSAFSLSSFTVSVPSSSAAMAPSDPGARQMATGSALPESFDSTNMVSISPGGTFSMEKENRVGGGAIPGLHTVTVTVKPFELDVTEVTTAAYTACAKINRCTPAGAITGCNYGEPDKANNPALST